MNIKLLTEHHLDCLSFIGGCTGSSESIHVKMQHCWKSHVTAHIVYKRTRDNDFNVTCMENKVHDPLIFNSQW